ncbi:MAG: hypothetical protein PHO40_05305 [Candidatus Omnitrophica bacterium]|jgi:hypothetical protein|nr:hypothetical protein [Candidatus Omnitrophota bacterium]
MITSHKLKHIGLLVIFISLIICKEPAFAKKEVSSIPDPDKLVLEAQKLVSIADLAAYEQLPVEESSKDGYWWNKQNRDDKLAYVKQLIAGFKLSDKRISAKKIVSLLDTEYNPRDNPLDIKMDKSIERMFNIITKEMMLK